MKRLQKDSFSKSCLTQIYIRFGNSRMILTENRKSIIILKVKFIYKLTKIIHHTIQVQLHTSTSTTKNNCN